MTPEQFREEGKKVIDWIADYYTEIEKYPAEESHPCRRIDGSWGRPRFGFSGYGFSGYM